jgi:hypothetical protein
VKIVLSALYFGLFVNVLVLGIETKREKKKSLTNGAKLPQLGLFGWLGGGGGGGGGLVLKQS